MSYATNPMTRHPTVTAGAFIDRSRALRLFR